MSARPLFICVLVITKHIPGSLGFPPSLKVRKKMQLYLNILDQETFQPIVNKKIVQIIAQKINSFLNFG